MTIRFLVGAPIAIAASLFLTGCVTRPPTIAHVHLGHALTGVHVTPGKVGYLSVAEEQAQKIVAAAQAAVKSNALPQIKADLATAAKAAVSEEEFGLRPAMVQAANHISFAAESSDASDNVRTEAVRFAKNIQGVVERCDLIGLLAKDAANSNRLDEAKALAVEIEQLARQNIDGVDSNKNGLMDLPKEYGIKQLRKEIADMIAREDPPYRTVDQFYLFNLVRLPNGKWVFDKFNRGGNIDGYK